MPETQAAQGGGREKEMDLIILGIIGLFIIALASRGMDGSQEWPE